MYLWVKLAVSLPFNAANFTLVAPIDEFFYFFSIKWQKKIIQMPNCRL